MIASTQPPCVPASAPSLLGKRLRANANYLLVAHSDLGAAELEKVAGLDVDANHYGLLIPKKFLEVGLKEVDHSSAELFQMLSKATVLPQEYLLRHGPDLNRRLVSLILDAVLEVEWEGEFVCGPASCKLLFDRRANDTESDHRLARCSREALRLACEVPIEEPVALSRWLYGYNAIPASPLWLSRLGSRDENSQLGLEQGGRNHERLGVSYVSNRDDAWLSWTFNGKSRKKADGHLGYKLYISPHPRALMDSFATIVDSLIDSEVSDFKLGNGPLGLLRSDKLVVYLDSWNSLRELASVIEGALSGTAAQGVPFTAPLTDNGLLSWGMDPPPQTHLSGWGEVQSWRYWLVNQLSRSILHARARGACADDCLDYATTRLRLEGVDTELWLASDQLWMVGRPNAWA